MHGWAGVGLCLGAWLLNSSLAGLRTHFLFFPLWLGYILAADALVRARTGSSLLTGARRHAVLLFVLSAPVWWLFEWINLRTQNWIYLGREQFSALSYFCFATLNFSTVIPAVFETAEWTGMLRRIETLPAGPRLAADHRLAAAGALMLALLLLFPAVFYPLVWMFPLCLLEPLNRRLGFPSLWNGWERGDWRTTAALGAGALICGFFWEMWNLHSLPKWIYHVPFAGACKVFEMPLLGYLGYLPFGPALFSFYSLACGLSNIRPYGFRFQR